jgi:hypothetical protein
LLGYGTNKHGYHVFNKTTSQVEIVIDVTFDETDGSQKEQVNVDVVGKEESSSQVIKKLTTSEVKPLKMMKNMHKSKPFMIHLCFMGQ